MSDEQEAKNIENEPETTEELSSDELDQVVGGTEPAKPKGSSSQQQTYLVVTLENVIISN